MQGRIGVDCAVHAVLYLDFVEFEIFRLVNRDSRRLHGRSKKRFYWAYAERIKRHVCDRIALQAYDDDGRDRRLKRTETFLITMRSIQSASLNIQRKWLIAFYLSYIVNCQHMHIFDDWDECTAAQAVSHGRCSLCWKRFSYPRFVMDLTWHCRDSDHDYGLDDCFHGWNFERVKRYANHTKHEDCVGQDIWVCAKCRGAFVRTTALELYPELTGKIPVCARICCDIRDIVSTKLELERLDNFA